MAKTTRDAHVLDARTTAAPGGSAGALALLRESVSRTLDAVQKRFGREAVMVLGGDGPGVSYEALPTGSLALDAALGIGGLPRGRIVEIYGPESSGKTTLMLHVIAQAQRAGLLCAFVDAEHAFDASYAAKLGVSLSDMLVSQPDHGEQALEIVDMLARSGNVGLIVVDSVAALIPKAELEGEMGDSHVGLHARLMSQAMRKVASIAANSNTCVVFINQLRQKIGVMFGPSETTTGGNALKYFASVRLDIRRIATVKEGERAVASRVRVKTAKNKCAPPFQQAEFEIAFGAGIDQAAEVLDWAVEHAEVTRSGSWYSIGGERMGQGRPAALEWLRANPSAMERLRETARAAMLGAAASGRGGAAVAQTPSSSAVDDAAGSASAGAAAQLVAQ